MRLLLLQTDSDGAEIVDTVFQVVCANNIRIKLHSGNVRESCKLVDGDIILWPVDQDYQYCVKVIDVRIDGEAYSHEDIEELLDIGGE